PNSGRGASSGGAPPPPPRGPPQAGSPFRARARSIGDAMQTHARRPATSAPVRAAERAPAGAGPHVGERPAPLTEAGVRALQASAGNRAVVQRLTDDRVVVQREIGQPQAQ